MSHLHERKSDESVKHSKHTQDSVTEQRPWGSFELFTLNEKSTVKLVNVDSGKRLSLQYHSERSEFWKVVTGMVEVTLNSSKVILKKGDIITIPVGAIHRIAGIEDSIILEISFGEFDEKDIVRLDDDFGRSKRRAKMSRMTRQSRSEKPRSESGQDIQSSATATFSKETASLADMLRTCKEEENIEGKLDILRKINALLSAKQRLLIPSLVTVQYIENALSDIEEKVLSTT